LVPLIVVPVDRVPGEWSRRSVTWPSMGTAGSCRQDRCGVAVSGPGRVISCSRPQPANPLPAPSEQHSVASTGPISGHWRRRRDRSPTTVSTSSRSIPQFGFLRRTGAQQARQVLDRWSDPLGSGRCRRRDGRAGAESAPDLEWDVDPARRVEARTGAAVRRRSVIDGCGPSRRMGCAALDWVCDRLSPAQLTALRHFIARQLVITNRN